MPKLNSTTVVGLARDLEQQLEAHPVELGEALVELIRGLAASADEVRAGISPDVYLQRGLRQWDRDRDRLEQQLERVFLPSIRGEVEDATPADTVPGDVTGPIVRGVWPAWIPTLPQYAGGVKPTDPLLPPTTRVQTVQGVRTFKTLPVASAVAQLWSEVHVAADFDRELGAERLRAVLTKTAAAFERPDDTGNEGETNVWRTIREWANAAGELAGNAGSNIWDTGGIQTALLVGAGVLGLGFVAAIIFRR